MNDMNGKPPGQATTAAHIDQTPNAQREEILRQITPGIRNLVQINGNGLLASYQNQVPAHVIFQVLAFELGMYFGFTLDAPIEGKLQLRKLFTKAFEDGLCKAPLIKPAPGASGAPQWEPPPGEKIGG